MNRFDIFAILKWGTTKQKEKLRKQIGEERWKENIQLWKKMGGKVELWMVLD